MKYHLAINRNEPLTQATTWMNLGHTMLLRGASHKGRMLCDSTYMKRPEQANAWRWEAGFVAGAGGGSGVRRWRRQVQGFLSGDESVLILIAVMNAQLCEHTKSP